MPPAPTSDTVLKYNQYMHVFRVINVDYEASHFAPLGAERDDRPIANKA